MRRNARGSRLSGNCAPRAPAAPLTWKSHSASTPTRTSCTTRLLVTPWSPEVAALILSPPSEAHLPGREASLTVLSHESQARILVRCCEAPRLSPAAAVRRAAGCRVPCLCLQNRGLHGEGESGTTHKNREPGSTVIASADFLNKSMDQYTKGEQLGKGTFGTVFKATHTQVWPCTCMRSKHDAKQTASPRAAFGGPLWATGP